MHESFLLTFAIVSFSAFAADPDVVITTKNSYNGYATVAGRVASGRGIVGISVDNGRVRYSTIADPSGAWALVFRHAAVNFTVRAWRPESPAVEVKVEDRLAFPITSQN